MGTWLLCGIPPLAEIALGLFHRRSAATFLAAFVIYGAGLSTFAFPQISLRTYGTAVQATVLGTMSVMGLLMVDLSGNGTLAAMLVIVAAVLPYIVSSRLAWAWVVVQSVLLAGIYWHRGTWQAAVASGVALGGFQCFAAVSSILVLSERRVREDLARSNAELHATRALLSESGRADERLRISRDLHDTMGHHLTALSLQLDVASRVSTIQAIDHVSRAHAITRLLLADLRNVVSSLRESSPIDLAAAIRALVSDPAATTIHLDMPPVLPLDNIADAEALLRCVQEVITNTTRHAGAANLWIRIESATNGLFLHARDDGRGSDAIVWGHGLTGMRERFERLGGSVEVASHPGSGFTMRAFIPRVPR